MAVPSGSTVPNSASRPRGSRTARARYALDSSSSSSSSSRERQIVSGSSSRPQGCMPLQGGGGSAHVCDVYHKHSSTCTYPAPAWGMVPHPLTHTHTNRPTLGVLPSLLPSPLLLRVAPPPPLPAGSIAAVLHTITTNTSRELQVILLLQVWPRSLCSETHTTSTAAP